MDTTSYSSCNGDSVENQDSSPLCTVPVTAKLSNAFTWPHFDAANSVSSLDTPIQRPDTSSWDIVSIEENALLFGSCHPEAASLTEHALYHLDSAETVFTDTFDTIPDSHHPTTLYCASVDAPYGPFKGSSFSAATPQRQQALEQQLADVHTKNQRRRAKRRLHRSNIYVPPAPHNSPESKPLLNDPPQLTELNCYHPRCSPAYPKRNRGKHTLKADLCRSRLSRCAPAWEFGQFVDFSHERHCRNYLVYVADWLNEIHFPHSTTDIIRFAKQHKTECRVLAWRIISHVSDGNPGLRATALIHALQGTLDWPKLQTKRRLHTAEPGWRVQSWTYLGLDSLYHYLSDKPATYAKRVYAWFGESTPTEKAKQFIDLLVSGASNAKELFLSAMKWIKEKVVELLANVASSAFIRLVFKWVLIILLVKLVLYAILTLLPAAFSACMDYFSNKFGLKSQTLQPPSQEKFSVQSGDSIVSDLISTIGEFFAVPGEYLLSGLGKLPKLASIGKAIEWFLEKGTTLVTLLIEFATGKPIPITQLESTIIEFTEKTALMSSKLGSGDIGIILAEESILLMDKLGFLSQAILSALSDVKRDKPLRPSFTHLHTSSLAAYQRLKVEFDSFIRSARTRPTPVFVVISGDPGCGKTRTMNALPRDIHPSLRARKNLNMVPDRPFTLRDVYPVNQKEEFFDGYARQTFVTIDDLFQQTDNETRARTANFLINVICDAPYPLRVATIAQKSVLFFESRCIIATTNYNKNWNELNAQLTSYEAFADRITFHVHMLGEDRYLLKAGKIAIDGQSVKTLTYLELAAAIQEAMIARERQLRTPPPINPIPNIQVDFSSSRLSFSSPAPEEMKADEIPEMEIQMFSPKDEINPSAPDKEKGAELPRPGPYENIEAYKAYIASTSRINQIDTDVPITLPTKEDIEELLPGPDEPEAYIARLIKDPPVTDYQMLFPNEEQSTIPDVVNSFSYGLKDLEIPRYNDPLSTDPRIGKRYRHPQLPFAFLHDSTVFLSDSLVHHLSVSRYFQQNPAQHPYNRTVTPYFVDTMKYYLYYAGNGICGITSDLSLRDAIVKDVTTPSTKFPCRPIEINPPATPLMFRLPLCVLKRVAKRYPQFVFPNYTAYHRPPVLIPTWIEVKSAWLDAPYVDLDDAKKYNSFLEDYELPSSEIDFRALFEKVNSSHYYLLEITAGLAALGIGCVLAWKACRWLLPGFAYEEIVQSAYPNAHQPRPHIARTSRSNRPSTPRLQKYADVRAAAQNLAVQGNEGTDSLHRIFNANLEVVECHAIPRGAKSETVPNTPILAWSFALFIGGRRALMPIHTAISRAPDPDEFDVYLSLVRGQRMDFKLRDCVVHGTLPGDLMIIEFPGYPERRSIVHLFADVFPSDEKVGVIRPYPDSPSAFRYVPAAYHENILQDNYLDGYDSPIETSVLLHNVPNSAGMCGAPYVSDRTGLIFAIHMAGHVKQQISAGTIILRSDIAPFDPHPIDYHNPIVVPLMAVQAGFAPGIHVLGALPPKMKSFVNMKTELTRSDFNMDRFPFPETNSSPATLSPRAIDNILRKMAGCQQHSVIKLVDVDYLPFLPTLFSKHRLRKLTLKEAIFGVPGWISSIDMTNSVGWFYKRLGFTRRSLCFNEKGEPEIHPLLQADIEQAERELEAGHLVLPVYETFLKDELRDAERVAEAKTRPVDSADFRSFLLAKMYLGTLLEELQADPVRSPCALGIDPHSCQWGQLLARLCPSDVAVRFLVGDFSSWDWSVKNWLRDKFREFVKEVYLGTPLEIPQVDLLILSIFLGWHIFGALVYLRSFGTNTGSLITGLFNSFCNWLIHTHAFVNLYGQQPLKLLQGSFTGDDSFVTVPQSLTEFTMKYLAQFFHDVFGMTYTSCYKDDREIFSLAEVMYLKRRFVIGDLGVMAPLDPTSIYDMVAWVRKDPNRNILQSILDSLLLEGFHYGRATYDSLRTWVKLQNIEGGNFAAPTYDAICELRRPAYRLS
jgi:hypothetical protein